MDINALLSPTDEAPPSPLASSAYSRDGDQSATSSPRKQQRMVRPGGGKRTASGLSRELSLSPDRSISQGGSPIRPTLSPLTSFHEVAPKFRPYQPPTSRAPHRSPDSSELSFGYALGQQQTFPQQQRPVIAHRPNSNPQMDVSDHSAPMPKHVLADLASPRHHRSNSATLKHSDRTESQRSPLLPPPMLRNGSGQSLADLTMAEAPAQTPPPRSIITTALSDEESQAVTDLLNHLRENSYAYDSHTQLINLLHKGFLAHIYPLSDAVDQTPCSPSTYGLLSELRQAREAMDSRFAVGEDLWVDWLADEVLLAQSSEERITVTELFQKALQDEPASTTLWAMYADWVQASYTACNDLGNFDPTMWSEEDKEVCKELFTKEMLANVLEQAATATQWRIDESYILWNRHAQLTYADLPAKPSTTDVEHIRSLYVQRLQVPHSTWSETYQMFWPIVNKYEGENWEAIMDQINNMGEPAKQQMRARENHESSLDAAMSSGDRAATFAEFERYLAWEAKMASKPKKGKKKGHTQFDSEVRCALFERALLRFPTYTEWWLDYIDFATTCNLFSSLLPLIERATRHCPWSGDLWGRRILRADVEQKPHQDIEQTKHRATNSGLLDVGGMEELLKVLQQWCSYLRRHAFRRGASEDDLDTAEVGITMALEDIDQAGKTLYGPSFKGDPLYRLETIQIKFFSEARRFKDSRDIYKKLTTLHGSKYDLWQTYHQWELWLWGYERISEQHRVETSENGPHLATAVVQQALKQRDLDEPEKVLVMYLNHFQQHESGEKLQAAMIEAREFSTRSNIKKAKEAAEAAVHQQETQPPVSVAAEQPAASAKGEKRKADDGLVNGEKSKKSKTEQNNAAAVAGEDAPDQATAQATRDRENSTVTLRNLATDVTELDIKRFFRDVGQPKSINIVRGTSSGTTAMVEFESPEDVLTAKSRNGKDLKGHEVRISSGSQTTLYVTNYPATFDEAAIRELFDSFGEVVSVRFPSLRFNSKRRFCYVSFFTTDKAQAAEAAMDGKMLDGQHRLLAKVSNPDAKTSRASSAQDEGREIIVRNVNFKVPESDVHQLFTEYGSIERLHLVTKINGQRTGTVFVAFSTAEEAFTACAATDKKPFHDRILQVAISNPKGGTAPIDKARKTDIIVKGLGAPASPEADTLASRRGSDVSMASGHTPAESGKTIKERNVAILNLPDTVNDARIRAAMEVYGPIIKIQLRRDQNGAIVEFQDLQAAFNVRQGVDCSSLGPDVRTGDVQDLLGKKKAPAAGLGGLRPSFARPTQRGAGRRGGLGSRRGGFGASASTPGPSENESGAPKSNAAFREMLQKSRAVHKDDDAGK